MHNEEKAISDIMTGRLHMLRNELQYNQVPIYAVDFIAGNKDKVESVVKSILEDYHLQRNTSFDQSIQSGVIKFLIGEGILNNGVNYTSEQAKCLSDIESIIRKAINPKSGVTVVGCFLGDRGITSAVAYIDLKLPTLPYEAIRHEPGIPIPSLTREKVQPIADWIIKQAKSKRPDIFL